MLIYGGVLALIWHTVTLAASGGLGDQRASQSQSYIVRNMDALRLVVMSVPKMSATNRCVRASLMSAAEAQGTGWPASEVWWSMRA